MARNVVAGASRDGEFTGGRILSLRGVYTHMIEEYARHTATPTCCGRASTGRQAPDTRDR